MIPVHLKKIGFSEPSSSLYYLVAANHIFLVKKTHLFSSVSKAYSVPGLVEQEESLSLRFPKVPRQIMEQVYRFFLAVYQKWDGEAVVFLYYAASSGSFRVSVPPQTLFRYKLFGQWRTEMRVSYGYLPRPEGFVKLCDAHSHADLPAFFSCTDDRDDKEDGLRIIIGKLHRPKPDISVSFVANGTRFMLRPEDTLEDFSTSLPPPPQEWLEKVTCKEMKDKVEEDGQDSYGHGKGNGH